LSKFKGRHVVVTGGSGALGGAVVANLIDGGAICHLADRRTPDKSRCPHRDHADVHMHYEVDVTDEASVGEFYAGLPELYASIHCAGAFAMAPLTETTLSDFRRMLDINLTSAFLCCREATRAIRDSGGEGRLVNIIARPAISPCGGMTAYAVSKAAIASLTQCLSEELRGEGIFVNAVAPSIFDTPGNRAAMPDADHDSWAKPEALASTIHFLASPYNQVTSGALVPVYGRA